MEQKGLFLMLTVYSKNLCPFCVQAKHQLDKYGITYEEINIEENAEARDFVISEGHRTMPQIYHNGKVFVTGGAQGLQKLDEDTIRAKMGEIDLGGFEL